MPGTDGGSSTNAKASVKLCNMLVDIGEDAGGGQAALDALLERLQRNENNTGVGALVKVAPSKPANATDVLHAGRCQNDLATPAGSPRRCDASEAPGGN